jgi:hypothetical protein
MLGMNLVEKRFTGLDKYETREKYLSKEIDDKVLDEVKLENIWEARMYQSSYSKVFTESLAEQKPIPTPRGSQGDIGRTHWKSTIKWPQPETEKRLNSMYPGRSYKFYELL